MIGVVSQEILLGGEQLIILECHLFLLFQTCNILVHIAIDPITYLYTL